RVARGEQLGLLDGVPVSIKETAALAGYRNSLGSLAFEKSIAQVDSFAIGRLKDEGAVILGKTNAPEFGTRPITEGPMFPPARNPVDTTRTAGGSSGGAAAAVAAGLCALSHGGDGGGSIRIPASCCGVVGLKPSRGRISSGPLLGEDWAGLATSGVIARTVADAALGLDAMSALPIASPELLDPLNQRMLEAAPLSTAVDYLKALIELHQQARRLIGTWDQIDVLLTPTLTYPAPNLGEVGQNVDTASDEFL